MKKKSILPHSKMLFLQLVNSRIIGSLKEPKNTFGKRACSNWDCDFASYVSEIKVKGEVKTWWNEDTAPCITFSMVNYTYCQAK